MDLERCPFCGGQAKLLEEYLDERFAYANKVTVRCAGCNVAVSACGIIPHGGYADNSTTEKRAIDAWNRRAAPPPSDTAQAPIGWQLVPTQLTDEQRRKVAKAIVETYLVFPAPGHELGYLDLKAVDAALAALHSDAA